MVIDEIQRVPELLLPIKVRVDGDPRAGRYLLSGSARVLGLRALPDARRPPPCALPKLDAPIVSPIVLIKSALNSDGAAAAR
jgi:hypothetical protein